jgi:predicted tellurium resistance membrane protein TerC
MNVTARSAARRHHYVKGVIAGVIGAIGLAVVLVTTNVVALGTWPPIIVAIVFFVVAVLWTRFAPIRRRKRNVARP